MTTVLQAQLEILADSEALGRRVADWLLAAATAREDGVFSVALSGGTTPRTLYERLAAPPYRDSFPWDRTHWFWGDERFVPHDDPRSNYRMVREALLSRVPIPATHRSRSASTAVPGNSDAVCPSGPNPSKVTSKSGRAGSSRFAP